METDIYSFAFRGLLVEESLDKAGRMKYSPEAFYFSEEDAKKLFLYEIDERYVQQSKSMITAFATITAFENATREFIHGVLYDNYKNDWWDKGIQPGIKSKAETRKANEDKVKWHINRGDAMMSYLDFGDLSKIMVSSDNWRLFEPYFAFDNGQQWIKSLFEDIEKSRNVIMHSGVLDEYAISRIGLNVRDWLHQINV